MDGSNVVWGRWLDGSVTNADGSTWTGATLPGGVNYLFSDVITTSAVIAAKSGLITYTFAGGPRATDNLGNVGTTMSGNLGIDFTARTATPNVSYTVAGSTYNITGFSMAIRNVNGGAVFGTGSSVISPGNNTGSCTGGACTGAPINSVNLNGIFVGATGKGVITNLSTTTTATNTTTTAVGVFKAP